jgi:hypothetical protein
MVLLWLGYVTVTPTLIFDHPRQFGNLGGSSKHHRTIMNLLWLPCVWVIWNESNNQIFKHKEHFLHELFDKTKLQIFWWLKAKYATLSFYYHS